jgi:hypothetical protein
VELGSVSLVVLCFFWGGGVVFFSGFCFFVQLCSMVGARVLDVVPPLTSIFFVWLLFTRYIMDTPRGTFLLIPSAVAMILALVLVSQFLIPYTHIRELPTTVYVFLFLFFWPLAVVCAVSTQYKIHLIKRD